MSDVSAAVEVATGAAVAVIEAEAATEARVENAIAGAAARTEIAEQTAQQLADAAMESERGQRLVTLEGSVASCQQSMEALRMQVGELSNQITAMATKPPELVVINPAPAKLSSTPPASPEAVTQVEAVTLDPASVNAGGPPEEQTAPPTKKKRHLF